MCEVFTKCLISLFSNPFMDILNRPVEKNNQCWTKMGVVREISISSSLILGVKFILDNEAEVRQDKKTNFRTNFFLYPLIYSIIPKAIYVARIFIAYFEM